MAAPVLQQHRELAGPDLHDDGIRNSMHLRTLGRVRAILGGLLHSEVD